MPAIRIRFVALLATVLITACTSVQPDKLQKFSTGVTTAKDQANTAFAAVNTLTSGAVVDHAASMPTLKDENFYDVLDSNSVAQWQAVFSALEKYCQTLALLTSSDITKNYANDVVTLATQIKTSADTLKSDQIVGNAPTLSPGIAAAVAETGNILLKAKARGDAKKVLTALDPCMRKVLIAMADSIGSTGKQGIRGTVYSNWEVLKAGQKAAFVAVLQKPKTQETPEEKDNREKAEFTQRFSPPDFQGPERAA